MTETQLDYSVYRAELVEEALLAADQVAYQTSSQLLVLSDLVWRGGKRQGPYLDIPCDYAALDTDWIEDMKGQLEESLKVLSELQAAKECIEFERKQALELMVI